MAQSQRIEVVKIVGRNNPGRDGAPGKDGSPGAPGRNGTDGTNGRGFYATNANVTITANGSVNKISIAGGANDITVGSSIIDSTGGVYSVASITSSAVTVGAKLMSLKGAQGTPGAGITIQAAIADLAAGADAATITTKVNSMLAALRAAGVIRNS